MYLVDTNIGLERLFDQDQSGEAARFLAAMPSDDLFITDFAFPLNRRHPDSFGSHRCSTSIRPGEDGTGQST